METLWQDMTTNEVAQFLLGKLLVHDTPTGRVSGYIVETESYLGVIDKAAHSYGHKETPRLQSMYKKAGTIYIYQMHRQKMLNLVTQSDRIPEAVLIRAIEPYENIALMEIFRGKSGYELANGPGKLTQALQIDMSLDGNFIYADKLFLHKQKNKQPTQILTSARIGIPNKDEWTAAPLRFYVAGNPYVSKMRKSDMDLVTNGWQSQ